jgi:4-hydroxy-2-oxoheptanedioate aldolase
MLINMSRLKDNGLDSLKCSFEDEGVNLPYFNQHFMFCYKNNIDLTLKIGGCEARSDILFSKEMGVKKIVAPMIETSFAASKFESCLPENDQHQRHYILIESVTGLNNFEEIVGNVNKNKIEGFVVGRSDLCRSFGLDPSKNVDSDFIMSKVKNVYKICKDRGFKTVMGGNVNTKTLPLLDDLINLDLLDFFETRKVVFNSRSIKRLEDCISDALVFEKLFLEKRIMNLELEAVAHKDRIKKLILR